MLDMEIFNQLTSYPAVSGNEEKLSILIRDLFRNYCTDVNVDRFYNVIGYKKGYGKNKKRVMMTAHYDEIGFIVKSIDEKGFIRFTSIGGIDSKILLAQEVTIHGRRDVTGVIGAKPPHLLKDEETKNAVKIEDLYIDTGMDAQALKDSISIGDVITFNAPPVSLKQNAISGKCMDNRSGIAVLLQTMVRLASIMHKDDVYFVATVQEEVGLEGAIISSYNINPDMAIVVDACHGDMPDLPDGSSFKLGKGPAIAIGPNLHAGLTKQVINIARSENIPYQIDVEPGDTGTETWAIQVSRCGIPTVLISIPVRYMHTPVETVNTNDIKYAGMLISSFVKEGQSCI